MDGDYGDVGWLRQAATRIRATDLAKGGDEGYEAAVATATSAYKRLINTNKASVEHTLAVGNLASVVAMKGYDHRAFVDAAHWAGRTVALGDDAGSQSLQARGFGIRSRIEMANQLPELAVAHLLEATDLPDLSGTDQAMLYALLARAEAMTGEPAAACLAMDQAREAWETKRSGWDGVQRPWVSHWVDNPGHMNGDLGTAARHLVAMESFRVDEAVTFYRQAIATCTAPRSQILQSVAWASMDCAYGDLERGLRQGHHTADRVESSGMNSTRVREKLSALSQVAEERDGRSLRVVELQDRLMAFT